MRPHHLPPHGASTLRAFATLLLAFAVSVGGAGCLGIERTEWAFRATQITGLQDDGLSGDGIVVGIVDTGIDPKHPSLDHITIKAWRDYINGRTDPYDDSGHGTHVAGILAARGGVDDWFAGADLMGVAPDVSLVVVKACGEETCSVDGVEKGIDWAVSQGIDVLTLSLGGEQVILNLGDGAIQAVQRATAKGVYVVVAAGNAGTDHGDVESPSSQVNAIAVGAIDRNERVADFSSQGSESANNGQRLLTGQAIGGRADPNKKPELVAPGVNILSSWKGATYARASGTSQAAPFVAGIIALLLEEHPEWRRTGSQGGDADAVRSMKTVLTESAKPLAGQDVPHDNASGYGLVQAADASRALANA